MKNFLLKTLICVILLMAAKTVIGQQLPTIAVVSIDSKGLDWDNETIANILRLELEKVNKYEVLDKYDVNTALEENSIDPNTCFGKNAVMNAGKILNADKMLTGSAELFGDKIILILRMVDVNGGQVELTSVMEYLNVQKEIQTMVMISLNDLLGIPNDPHLVDLLINYNLPITTARTTVSLSGPRMGVAYTIGNVGDRMVAPESKGGFNMFPVTSMFGYQYEKQYLSSGDFQALVEVLGTVNGLESGQVIPSVSILNGFRFNNSGFELGVGPTFRLIKEAEGFEDQSGNWILTSEVDEIPAGADVKTMLDNRGDYAGSVGLVVAVGRTFRSGYLNVPVNVYCIPRKEGSVFGVTFGFITTKKPKL